MMTHFLLVCLLLATTIHSFRSGCVVTKSAANTCELVGCEENPRFFCVNGGKLTKHEVAAKKTSFIQTNVECDRCVSLKDAGRKVLGKIASKRKAELRMRVENGEVESKAYGPDGCLSTKKNEDGACMIFSNKCETTILEDVNVGFTCVQKDGSAQVHFLGENAFAGGKTELNTSFECAACLSDDDDRKTRKMLPWDAKDTKNQIAEVEGLVQEMRTEQKALKSAFERYQEAAHPKTAFLQNVHPAAMQTKYVLRKENFSRSGVDGDEGLGGL